MAFYKVAYVFGTLVAETILASVHGRAQQQAGRMDASDAVKSSKNILRAGAVHVWAYRSGEDSDEPIVLLDYQPGRGRSTRRPSSVIIAAYW